MERTRGTPQLHMPPAPGAQHILQCTGEEHHPLPWFFLRHQTLMGPPCERNVQLSVSIPKGPTTAWKLGPRTGSGTMASGIQRHMPSGAHIWVPTLVHRETGHSS